MFYCNLFGYSLISGSNSNFGLMPKAASLCLYHLATPPVGGGGWIRTSNRKFQIAFASRLQSRVC